MRDKDYQQNTTEYIADWPFLDITYSAEQDCILATVADAEMAQLLNQLDEELIQRGIKETGPRMMCKAPEQS